MKTFRLGGLVTISVYTVVEANSLEEAIEMAGERDVEAHDWWDKRQDQMSWVSTDFDGEVFDIKEE